MKQKKQKLNLDDSTYPNLETSFHIQQQKQAEQIRKELEKVPPNDWQRRVELASALQAIFDIVD